MSTAVRSAFERMGARVEVQTVHARRTGGTPWGRKSRGPSPFLGGPVQVDIFRDVSGEYFHILRHSGVEVSIFDVRSEDRHLLLVATDVQARVAGSSSFLCGHDERAWFVAAIPEEAAVRTVQDAKDALKPKEVWDAIERFGVPMENRDQRHTAGFVRQGEWFFIPCPEMDVEWDQVVYNEPIQRGAGKPHQCDEMFRQAGELVYVSRDYPNGLTAAEFQELPDEERERTRWMERVRDADVFVRGRIRHRDHDTINLPFWHKVVMNTEARARAMRQVAFLD